MYAAPNWALTKTLQSKLDGSYTRVRGAILNIWRRHPAKSQLYKHMSNNFTSSCERRIHFAGQYWQPKPEIACHLLFWTPSYGKNGSVASNHLNLPAIL